MLDYIRQRDLSIQKTIFEKENHYLSLRAFFNGEKMEKMENKGISIRGHNTPAFDNIENVIKIFQLASPEQQASLYPTFTSKIRKISLKEHGTDVFHGNVERVSFILPNENYHFDFYFFHNGSSPKFSYAIRNGYSCSLVEKTHVFSDEEMKMSFEEFVLRIQKDVEILKLNNLKRLLENS